MVALKRKVIDLIADPISVSSSNPQPSSSDRRTKAIRSCSNWNTALLHGRRTRGPQWDYATASYHVSKRSTEYYKGVTRIQSHQPTHSIITPIHPANSSSNLYPFNPSSHGLHHHPRVNSNLQLTDRHPHHPHGLPLDPDQFSNRPIRHSSQHSQASSSHPRSIAHHPTQPNNTLPTTNTTPTPTYSLHPTHLQPVGNHQLAGPQTNFNHSLNDPKSTIFNTQQAPNPNLIPSPHFQQAPGPHAIPRHMSTTPSLPSSQPERKADQNLSHSGSYSNHPAHLNQQTLERSHSTQLGPSAQSYPTAAYQPVPVGFEKVPGERIASPSGHPPPIGSPSGAHHGEPGMGATNRKLYPVASSPSLHSFSPPPPTTGSNQPVASGPTNASQIFQPPIQHGYPAGSHHYHHHSNGSMPVSISSQARTSHYHQPNMNHLKPVSLQGSSMAGLEPSSEPANQFNQVHPYPPSQSQSFNGSHLINHPSMITPTMSRSIHPAQFYPGVGSNLPSNQAPSNVNL